MFELFPRRARAQQHELALDDVSDAVPTGALSGRGIHDPLVPRSCPALAPFKTESHPQPPPINDPFTCMSIQNFLLSAVLRWQKKSSLKLSAEHRFRRNRKWLADVRTKTKASITIQSDRIAGVPVEWVMPSELVSARQSPVCLYFHGGGFGMGGPNSHRALAAYLAEKAQIKMLMVDYCLAPEHPFPAALDDAKAVYLALISNQSETEAEADSAEIHNAPRAPRPLYHRLPIERKAEA